MSVAQQQIQKNDSITIVTFRGQDYFGFTPERTPQFFTKEGSSENFKEEKAYVKTSVATEDSIINIDITNIDLWDDMDNSYALIVPLIEEASTPVRIPA